MDALSWLDSFGSVVIGLVDDPSKLEGVQPSRIHQPRRSVKFVPP